ncbi:MAG: agmatine deiminase family protein [Candidatus Tenebribacter davisii]|nr:agmatine deiminase family protein [Candidatus Tenebribacter davisii]
MRKIIVLFFLVFVIQAISLNGMNNVTKKTIDNPILAHFLHLDELLLNEYYERNFTPTDPPVGEVRQTSEFEQMEGVLVVYPLGVPYALIAEMSQDTKVYTIVESYQQNQCETSYQSNGVNLENCEFINASTDSYWVRDFGPWFIDNGGEIAIVDFPYNRPRPDDDEIPIVVADYFGLDLYGMDLIHTGGNYMTDGMSISASSELVVTENPSLTIAQIDQFVLDYLGVETYHKVPDPNNTYIDHIDCWGKFLDVDKILIREVPVTHPQYDEIEVTAAYFAAQTSSYGMPYEVYRVNTPYDQPYTNSLILNDRVFVPITGNTAYDDAALQVYEDAMPGYEVLGFTGSWASTDALHCRTRGVADREMLYIQHVPIFEEMPSGEEIDIVAQIIPYSGELLYADSLLVNYKMNNGEFISIVMASIGSDNYSAMIPALDPGSEVSYFIHAADESEHSANHPFIGEPDPHTFTIAGNPTPAELVVDPTYFSIEMSANTVSLEIMELSNIGGLSMDYNMSETADWLSLDPTSGTLPAGVSQNIELSFDTTDMISGSYDTNITIIDNREETIIPIILTITQTNAGNEVINNTKLIGNYPNPFNPETTIKYSLKNNANMTLSIYNTKGQLVNTLVKKYQIAGMHSVVWNGKDANGKKVSSGVYLSSFDVEGEESDYTSVKKVILLK